MYLARFKMSKYSSFSLLLLPSSVVLNAPGSFVLEKERSISPSVYVGCSIHLHKVFLLLSG